MENKKFMQKLQKEVCCFKNQKPWFVVLNNQE